MDGNLQYYKIDFTQREVTVRTIAQQETQVTFQLQPLQNYRVIYEVYQGTGDLRGLVLLNNEVLLGSLDLGTRDLNKPAVVLGFPEQTFRQAAQEGTRPLGKYRIIRAGFDNFDFSRVQFNADHKLSSILVPESNKGPWRSFPLGNESATWKIDKDPFGEELSLITHSGLIYKGRLFPKAIFALKAVNSEVDDEKNLTFWGIPESLFTSAIEQSLGDAYLGINVRYDEKVNQSEVINLKKLGRSTLSITSLYLTNDFPSLKATLTLRNAPWMTGLSEYDGSDNRPYLLFSGIDSVLLPFITPRESFFDIGIVYRESTSAPRP